MSESLSGKTCYSGTRQQHPRQQSVTSFRRFKEYSLSVCEGLTFAKFQHKNPCFMPRKTHQNKLHLTEKIKMLEGGGARALTWGHHYHCADESHARYSKTGIHGATAQTYWHSQGGNDKDAIQLRNRIWHRVIRKHSTPWGLASSGSM